MEQLETMNLQEENIGDASEYWKGQTCFGEDYQTTGNKSKHKQMTLYILVHSKGNKCDETFHRIRKGIF
jgi:hypothetical protein